MKKKLLSVLLAMTLVAAAFTGCGASEEKTEASVSAEAEDKDEKEEDEKKEEESKEESKEESSESVAEVSDWSTAYDNYFDENAIMRDNSKLSTTMSESGITMDMVMAVSGENFVLGMDFGTAAMDIYVVDKVMYAKVAMEGEESWVYAPVESEEDVEGVKSMASTDMKNENIVSSTYREEVVEGDVVYDVLDVELDNEGETQVIACYVNRDTQVIDKFVMEEEGVSYEMLIEDIEGVELPAEAANATETTVDEIANAMVGVIMMVAMGSAEVAQ